MMLMTRDDLREALATLGWSWGDLAREVGVDRTVPPRWRSVPPDVARWIDACLVWHEGRPGFIRTE